MRSESKIRAMIGHVHSLVQKNQATKKQVLETAIWQALRATRTLRYAAHFHFELDCFQIRIITILLLEPGVEARIIRLEFA